MNGTVGILPFVMLNNKAPTALLLYNCIHIDHKLIILEHCLEPLFNVCWFQPRINNVRVK